MTARNAILKYLDTTTGHLTQNNEYEVIAWLSDGSALSFLTIDDGGKLYVAQSGLDPLIWQVIRI